MNFMSHLHIGGKIFSDGTIIYAGRGYNEKRKRPGPSLEELRHSVRNLGKMSLQKKLKYIHTHILLFIHQ